MRRNPHLFHAERCDISPPLRKKVDAVAKDGLIGKDPPAPSDKLRRLIMATELKAVPTTGNLDITPLTGAMGAEIRNLDLRG